MTAVGTILHFPLCMLKRTQNTTSNAKKPHHIIQLIKISAELKRPLLPIMYCSRPLDSVE